MRGKYLFNHVHPAALGLECLPCPFCASGTLGVYMGRTAHITCGTCGADGPAASSPTAACSTWNTRQASTMHNVTHSALLYAIAAAVSPYKPGIKGYDINTSKFRTALAEWQAPAPEPRPTYPFPRD